MENIFVTGANGQIGSELVEALTKLHPKKRIISLDIHPRPSQVEDPNFLTIDLLDKELLEKAFRHFRPIEVYHLAAVLSAVGEKDPIKAWSINMDTLTNILKYCESYSVKKVFWPSSIAVFGPEPDYPYNQQKKGLEPITVYGISKLAGENWCHYYKHQKGLDIRSLRFPGLISYKTSPGGGTTDYAVQIYIDAVNNTPHSCYLKSNTQIPMMYMPDAIRSIMELMAADQKSLRSNLAYNIEGFSASPEDFRKSIQEIFPDFKIQYNVDILRQKIADSWPNQIDDMEAKMDWNWKADFDLKKTTKDMIFHLQEIENLKIH